MVRYADDAVLCCECEADAWRVLGALGKRFERYGLELHPEKTRLVDFRRPRGGPRERGPDAGQSFDLLGFSHFWSRSRKGRWVVKRKTAKGRFGRALKRVAQWCRYNRHRPVAEQWRGLNLRLRGHDAYYGITGNSPALARFRHEVERVWRQWLNRRSHRAGMTWERFRRLLARYPLAPPRAVHSVYRQAAKP